MYVHFQQTKDPNYVCLLYVYNIDSYDTHAVPVVILELGTWSPDAGYQENKAYIKGIRSY